MWRGSFVVATVVAVLLLAVPSSRTRAGAETFGEWRSTFADAEIGGRVSEASGSAPLVSEGNRWTNLSPATNPLGRYGHTMVYDSQCDRIIMFGGAYESLRDDTWAYDYRTNTWTTMKPARAPPPLYWHGMAYDSQADRVILFGGMTSMQGTYNWDTWAYDYMTNTWTNMNPATNPRGADGPVMTYDSHSDRVVLFGGWSYDQTSNDTWAYDYHANAWTNVSPALGPSARFGQGMVYDSQADRIILFGGTYNSHYPYGAGSAGTDTWAYDTGANVWTNMGHAGSPPARDGPGMVYDPTTDRVLLFGGLDTGSRYLGDTWSYGLNSNTWSLVNPNPAPSPRWYPTWVHDSPAGRSVLFGGVAAAGFSDETWSFRTSPGSPSPPVTLTSTPGDATVHLQWQPPADDGGAPVTNYTIYRGTVSAGESLLLKLGNLLAYTDTGMTNGATYYYQVTATNALGEGARAGEVSATPTPPPPDTTPPAVTIVSPANNSILASITITVTGLAADNVALQKVELSTDGRTWTLASGTSSWSATLTLSEGDNTIYVRVTDMSGNVATRTIHVAVAASANNGLPVWVWPLLATGLVVAAVAAYVMMRRRRKSA